MSKYTKQGQREQALKENATPAGREAMKAYFEKKRQTETTSLSGRDAMKAYFEKKRVTAGSEPVIRQPQVQQTMQQPVQPQAYGINPVEEFLKNQPTPGMVNYSEGSITDIAGGYVTRLEQKMQAAETELRGVQTREQALLKRSEELKTAYANVEALREKYELTGDEVAGQAYLIAAERYNEQVAQHNKNLEKLQKDQKVYDRYNEAVYQYQKGKALYENRVAQQEEKARQEAEYLEQHPAEALANASLEEVEAKLEELENRLASQRMDYDTAKDTTRFDASDRKEMNRAEMDLKALGDSIGETYDKVQELRQLLKDKKNEQGSKKIWNSSAGEFVDRVDYAVQAGIHSGFAGLNAAADAVGNYIEWTIGATIGDIANLTGNKALKEKSDAWIKASKKYEGAADWQAAADEYMQDALVGAGKVDGWIAQQVQNIGSMMVDMYTVGMGGVASAGTSMVLPGSLSTGKVMAIRAGGSAAMEAAEKGYNIPQQIMVGVASGALEYISEKMFGGNPIYDTDKGWVTKGVEKLFGSSWFTKLLYTKGFDIFSEGLEEVFVELTQPVAEGILTATEIDFASGEDLLNAFAGGVFLSLAGGGAQVVANATADVASGRAKAERTVVNAIRNADAVQDLINEGLDADPDSEAYKVAEKLQEKLKAGKRLTNAEIGKQLFANQRAIDDGDLTDAPMTANKNAPEGALQKPEDGFYAIRTVTDEDGKTTYQLVQVHADGSMETMAEPAEDLLAAKAAAETKGMQIEQIGTVEALRKAAEEINNANMEADHVSAETDNETAETDNETAEISQYEESAPVQPEMGGIQWAGNEYEEGVNSNGAEQQAKPESRRMGQNDDQGRPAGSTDGGTGTDVRAGRAAEVVRRSREANRIKSAAATARIQRRSLKELGLPNGSDGKTLRVIPRGLDPAVDRAIEIVENAGMRCVPVSGSLFVETKSGEQRMLGVYYRGTVYLQADSIEATAEETAKHEVFHNRAKQDKTMVKRLQDYARANYTWKEIGERFHKYWEQYRDTYTYKNDDELQEMVWEEFLADVYAEYSRYGDLELEGFSEVVQEEAWRNEQREIRAKNEEQPLYSAASEDKARQRAEREIAKGIGEIMSMPRSAVQQLQQGLVREIMEEYQTTGDLSTEKLQDAVATAFAQGLVTNDEYYKTYKHVKDFLRTSPMTISEQDQADIADFTQFKKRAFGTLRIVKQGGTPVDTMYQQVQEMAPELLKPEKTHPADQLMQLYEVAREIRRVEKPLEQAMGEEGDQFYEWAEKKISDLVDRALTKYADSVQYKPPKAEKKTQTGEYPEYVPDDYDFRAHERMYNYGQQDFYEKPKPGSGELRPDYVQPEQSGLTWNGQSKIGNWDPEYPEYVPSGDDPAKWEEIGRTGQKMMEEFIPAPVEPEELTEEERARRGTMREWIQYVMRENQPPEEFAKRMRNSARGELKGGAKTLVERMEKTARQRNGDGVNLFRDPEMTDEEYEFLNAAWKNREQAAKDGKPLTVDELIIPKNAFRSTPAMDKLGIKIDGSVTRYRETDMLISYDKAAEQVQRNFNKRLKKLKATDQEMDLAKMIVAGSITPEMLNADQVNLNVVTELADYLWAIEGFEADRIYQRRAEIDVNNMRIAKELLKDSDQYHPQLKGMLESFTKIVMNERTPERIMKQIFGEYQGNRLYETYFRPVWVNGAEMYRFENRMKKRVEAFLDQAGTKRPLTELEREYVQRIMETKAVEDRMRRLDPDMRDRVKAAAHNIRNGMEYLDAVREQNIGKNEDTGGLVQAYVDYMRTAEVVKTMDRTILKNAAMEYRQIYNEMYAAINDFLVSHGYKPIGFIEGYAPHFQKAEVQNGLRAALKSLGVTTEKVDELPAEIAGRTADFKPNLKWNPHMKSRVGNKTDYDVQMGFERYLHYAAEIFYHTDDVMRIRQAVNFMRTNYSAEEVRAAIEDAHVDAFKDTDWKREFLIKKEVIKPQDKKTASEINQAYMAYVSGLFENAKPEHLRKYSELVTWMENYANIVAGKQSMADRGVEYGGGRNSLNFGTRLMRIFASANVAGNLSSVLNQSAQLPLLRMELGKGYLKQAARDMKNGTIAKENFADRSDFLTDKRGVDKLTVENTEKIISKLFKPTEVADRIMSTLAVRGRYLKALDEGKKPEEALRVADDFARRIMGSRMRGAKPLGFESKTFVNQMLHVFQVEAANTFDYMFLSDMPEAVKKVYKNKGKRAGNRYVAATAATYLLYAFILNSITDELYGGSPAPFDLIGWLLNFVAGGWGVDDDEFLKIIVDNGSERLFGKRLFGTRRPGNPTGLQWAGALEDLSYNIVGDVPYLRNVMGVLGVGDQSMPAVGINETVEAAKHAGKTVIDQLLYGKNETGLTLGGVVAEVAEDLGEIVAQVAPGGRQAKKTVQGIGSIIRGGKYSSYGENAKMLYPVDRNPWNAARAMLFGLSALDETDAYYAGGKSLTAAQTRNAKELKKQGVNIEDTYALYQVFSEINGEVGKEKITSTQARIEKRDAIASMDLDDEKKFDVYLKIMAANEETAMEKYLPLMDAGVTWQQLTDLDNAYTALGEDTDGDGEPDLDSVERGAAKRNAIAALDLTDYQKLEIYDRYHLDREAKNYETTRAEFEAMLDAGLSWDEITEAHNVYARLNADDEINATQKATAYAKWADEQGWSDKQKAAVKDRYTFWQMIPAEASSYEKFTGAGLDPEAADYVVSVLGDLEPEEGKEVVIDAQKIEAIAGSELETEDKNAAIRSMLSESQAATFDSLISQGLTAAQYAQYRRAVYGLTSDKDANGKTVNGSKKKKVLNAINGLKISSKLKDALYFAYGYTESTLKDAPWH